MLQQLGEDLVAPFDVTLRKLQRSIHSPQLFSMDSVLYRKEGGSDRSQRITNLMAYRYCELAQHGQPFPSNQLCLGVSELSRALFDQFFEVISVAFQLYLQPVFVPLYPGPRSGPS